MAGQKQKQMNVLAKYAEEDFQKREFISVFADFSNYKLILLLGIQVKLLEINDHMWETAEVIWDYITSVLQKHDSYIYILDLV